MIADILAALDRIESEAAKRFAECTSPDDVERLRVEYIGSKGTITEINRSIRALSPEDRRMVGKRVGEVRTLVSEGIERALERHTAGSAPKGPQFDVTLPGRTRPLGRRHPLTIVLDRIVSIFTEMGFSVAEGPEIETDYYNFEALNFPPDHPVRDMQDTYFLGGDWLLRTHTSPVQIRVMEKQPPPVRCIVPGRVYRNEEVNARSMNQFYQVEGLYVDNDVTFADLKGTLETFCRRFFSKETKVRFRPSFFPFTEPSAEVDVSCVICSGAGCRVCKNSGWLEILGAGMVDPNVFRSVNYDPEQVSGFAFGMGVDRTALMLFGLDDIRRFFENDLRLLEQFE